MVEVQFSSRCERNEDLQICKHAFPVETAVGYAMVEWIVLALFVRSEKLPRENKLACGLIR
jgi:hypothetical protein